jgi:hypothetical protein
VASLLGFFGTLTRRVSDRNAPVPNCPRFMRHFLNKTVQSPTDDAFS